MTAAAPPRLFCPRCNTPWPDALETLAAATACPRCGTETRAFLFPAFTRPPPQSQPAQLAVIEGEATCFYHPQKRAHVPCDACGRFLCALCDLELNGEHLCPSCLERGAKKGRIQSLEQRRTRWDQIVWSVLILPALLSCGLLAPLAALAGLGLVVWKRNTPGSLVDHSRLRLRFAAALAVVEFAGGIVQWSLMLAS